MINIYLAQVIVEDELREVEKMRLIEIANRAQKAKNRQRLANLARRFGLVRNGRREDNSVLQQHINIKDESLVEPIELSALCCAAENTE